MESNSFKEVRQAIHQTFPEVIVAPGLVIAATDSRYYSAITNNILHFSPTRLGPDDISRIHGINERISVTNYNEVVKFYARLIGNDGIIK